MYKGVRSFSKCFYLFFWFLILCFRAIRLAKGGTLSEKMRHKFANFQSGIIASIISFGKNCLLLERIQNRQKEFGYGQRTTNHR